MSIDNQGQAEHKARAYKKKKPKVPRKISPRYIYNSGLHYLSRFTASTGHFKFVMMRKARRSIKHHGEPRIEDAESIIDTVTLEFEELGLLNDELYTKAMVNSLRRRGKSKRAIETRLAQKRVPKTLVDRALKTYTDTHFEDEYDAEFQSALKFARKKKIGPYAHLRMYSKTEDEETKTRKALSMFARAGFSYDIAKRIMTRK